MCEPVLIPPQSERIVVGPADPTYTGDRCRSSRGTRKNKIEGAGPIFLFVLLFSGFIPSLFIDFDSSQLLKIIEAAIIAIVRPSPLFAAGDQGGPEPSRLQPCYCAGFQVADSAAPVFDGSPAPGGPSSKARARRGAAFKLRRSRGGLLPRAPPLFPIAQYTAV